MFINLTLENTNLNHNQILLNYYLPVNYKLPLCGVKM